MMYLLFLFYFRYHFGSEVHANGAVFAFRIEIQNTISQNSIIWSAKNVLEVKQLEKIWKELTS